MSRLVSRREAAELDEAYAMVLDCEMYHNHELIYDKHDVLRWRADPTIKMLQDFNMINLNDLVIHLAREPGAAFKNDYRMRDLYRRIGYSLSGYWEIFYWEVNNEDAGDWIVAADSVADLKTILKNLKELPDE